MAKKHRKRPRSARARHGSGRTTLGRERRLMESRLQVRAELRAARTV